MTGETIVSFRTGFHTRFEISTPPSLVMTSDNILIPVKVFPMFAGVLVGDSYDRRNDGQLSCSCVYIIHVTGRVVVCETYDRRDDVRCSLAFCKHVEVAARVLVVNLNTRGTLFNINVCFFI